MAAGLSTAAQLLVIKNRLDGAVEKVMRKISVDVTEGLNEATPVDTGFAAANWIPSIGKQFIVELGGMRPTAQSASAARGQQKAAIGSLRGYKLESGKIFVTNNVPYIGRLNDGFSTQAPAGFVQRAIAGALTKAASIGPL